MKTKSQPFSVYGPLKVKVEYCFDCQKWHAINETCSPYEEDKIIDEEEAEVIE